MQRGDDMDEFFRLWYIDFGGAYVYKDFENEEDAIKEAQQRSESTIKWLGKDNDRTKLEKHTISIIDFNH